MPRRTSRPPLSDELRRAFRAELALLTEEVAQARQTARTSRSIAEKAAADITLTRAELTAARTDIEDLKRRIPTTPLGGPP